MADVGLAIAATQPAPLKYTIPSAQEIVPKFVTATFDGSGAAAFVPTLQVLYSNGMVGGSFPLSSTVAAGAVADVSWFPHVAPAAAASSSGWQFDTDPQAGDWGVLSTSKANPNVFEVGGITGFFGFRIDDFQDVTTPSDGILFYSANAAGNLYDFIFLHQGLMSIETATRLDVNATGKKEIALGGTTLLIANIPTSNAGLTAGMVYRNGAGADVALMVK